MKVITLHTDDFERKCRDLARQVGECRQPFSFIVGIATGGDHVGKIIAEELSDGATRYLTVIARRPSTRHKTRFLETILRALPQRLNNFLRILEAKLLSSRNRQHYVDVELSDRDREAIAGATSPAILVVDDAVDSGSTMQSVIKELLAINPEAKVTTAAITVTTSAPAVNVDYSLYRNNTLIRFPWSKDMKIKP